jgi:hypothetical protein
MPIDPVVLISEELRSAATALRAASERYQREAREEDGKVVKRLLSAIRNLYGDLAETMPTSALGAGELVRLVVQLLPASLGQYNSHFNEVADRLAEGRRTQSDLVWLRAMHAALAGGAYGANGDKAIALLRLAIMGAARPIVVFRAATEMPASAGKANDWRVILNDPDGWESRRQS